MSIVSRAPSYKGFSTASVVASRVARATSAKRDTGAEMLLRRALWRAKLRYRTDVASLPGRPDIVFLKERLAIFCDGDFWHGRNLDRRLAKLAVGHNPTYWIAKIKSNVERDRKVNRQLARAGWRVLRLWESDVRANPKLARRTVLKAIRAQRQDVLAGRMGQSRSRAST